MSTKERIEVFELVCDTTGKVTKRFFERAAAEVYHRTFNRCAHLDGISVTLRTRVFEPVRPYKARRASASK